MTYSDDPEAARQIFVYLEDYSLQKDESKTWLCELLSPLLSPAQKSVRLFQIRPLANKLN